MGKDTGFLEYQRKENHDIPVKERILTFEEFHKPLAKAERRSQAARCMNCGVPFCQSAMRLAGMVTGCPLHNLIPEWNDQIYADHMEHAYARLVKTSNFPEFTGRVCPALCEKACTCGEYDEPVTVHDNELFLIETAFEKGYVKPRIPKVRSGKKVAVIGSGPSGLAAADVLNHRGHLVTVFERDDRVGGLLMYGIPNMKLDKRVVFRRQQLMENEGVVFRTGVDVGKNVTAKELLKEYDAVLLCCGAKEARSIKVPVMTLKGEPAEIEAAQVKGMMFAVDFLKSTTRALLSSADRSAEALKKQGGFVSAEGRHVVVVGGGDTGNDCIGTVIRHGCKSVTAIEMMPKPPEERREDNPWPQWPKVLKTDYGHEEAAALSGCDPRIYETTVKELFVNKKGELKKIKTVRVSFQGGKLTEIQGTEQIIPCDLLLIAAGFTGCESYITDAFNLKRTERGTIAAGKSETDRQYQTANEKVFAAGDMRRGQSLVVWAIAEGRACAKAVDEYLMGYTML